jgi:hypothetical protein
MRASRVRKTNYIVETNFDMSPPHSRKYDRKKIKTFLTRCEELIAKPIDLIPTFILIIM